MCSLLVFFQQNESIDEAETRIEQLLETISRHLGHAKSLPSVDEHSSLQGDLAFKTREMERSQATTQTLQVQRSC